MPLHVQRNYYYFQISILNEKNYFDSKHSMQVQCLFSCRCKKKDLQACGCSLCLMKFGSIVNTLQNISCLCKNR